MLAKAHFHKLVQQVQDLMNCGFASLIIGCPETDLRHPLLGLLPTASPCLRTWYGTQEIASLLEDEQVCALCDLATQTGQVSALNHYTSKINNLFVQSLVVAPLERPTGQLGFFLLADPLSNVFQQSEQLLLESFAQDSARSIEQFLRDTLNTFSSHELLGSRETSLPVEDNSTSNNLDHKALDFLKNEFVSMVSHELRTPLSTIKGYAGILQAYSIPDRLSENMEDLTPARQQQYLDIIVEQTNHLEVLINDLLDVSRIQAGRLTLRLSPIDIGALCQHAAQVAQYRSNQQLLGKYNINCVLAPELPLILADPDRVQQILANLLENAVKYSPEGGQIEIIASARRTLPPFNNYPSSGRSSANDSLASRGPAMMHITVRDQGVGIPHEQQRFLFKPFSRLEHSSTEQVPGAGLGLYISRKLIEAMGGTVILHSRQGEGTSVTFTLPLADKRHSAISSSGSLSDSALLSVSI